MNEVAFDALGRVVKSARRGPQGEGDTLAAPSVQLTYEHDRYTTAGLPARVKVEQREVHQDPGSRWTEAWTYSDGRGQVVMEKVRADDDDQGNPRWVGTGRVVLDEKGRPIRRYEPFFSATSAFEAEEGFDGVSATIHYDAIGRAVRIDLPDGTFEKVVFDAWSEEVWDASDTVLDSDWFAERTGQGIDSTDKKRLAAEDSAQHANTPTLRLLDALGRPVRVQRHAGFDGQGAPVLYTSRVQLDVQGNALAVWDARDIEVQRDIVDRLGRALFSTSPDAGSTWQRSDADDQVSTVWKTGDLKLATTFDALRRPLQVVRTVGSTSLTVEKYEYGELATGGYRKGRLWKRWDPAGFRALTYDFKGNVVATDQQVVLSNLEADWSLGTTQLSGEVFRTEVDVDALDRPVEQRSPGAQGASATALQAWTYTRRGLLFSVAVAPRGGTLTPRVSSVTYDARGQRQQLTRSDGTTDHVVTTYTYEPDTIRLQRLLTTRTGGSKLQDLTYVYDAVGNVSHKGDDAQDNVFFANTMVTPEETYHYDALHRLVQATGREAVAGMPGPTDVAPFVSNLPASTDPSAMRHYTESYTYDEADNLLTQHHFAGTVGPNPVWTRTFTVDSASNKLVSTTDGTTTWPVTYSDRGAVTALTHLPTMTRDHRDQLVGLVDAASPVTASYRYDADGQRVVRRVNKGATTEERLYLGSTEVFRRYDLNGVLVHERWSQWVSDGAARVLVLDQVGSVHDDDLPADEERWQLADLLGSGMVEVDETAAVISAEGYHPYGSTAWVSGKSEREVKSRRFRYTGKERDDESGMQAHGVRMYAPWLGRWMSADPIGLGDGLNRHLYVHANPVRGRDPSGMASLANLSFDEGDTSPGQRAQALEEVTGTLASVAMSAAQGAWEGATTIFRWSAAAGLTSLRRGTDAQELARHEAAYELIRPELEQLQGGATLIVEGREEVRMAEGVADLAFASNKVAFGGLVIAATLPGPNPTKSALRELASEATEITAERAVKQIAAEATEPKAVRAFAHGTTTAGSADIKEGGLSFARATEQEVGSYRPGAFYTHEIGPPENPGPGFDAMLHWANRAATDTGLPPGAVVMLVPEATLVKIKPHMTVGPVRGLPHFPEETVFSPEAFEVLNREATFQVIQ